MRNLFKMEIYRALKSILTLVTLVLMGILSLMNIYIGAINEDSNAYDFFVIINFYRIKFILFLHESFLQN